MLGIFKKPMEMHTIKKKLNFKNFLCQNGHHFIAFAMNFKKYPRICYFGYVIYVCEYDMYVI